MRLRAVSFSPNGVRMTTAIVLSDDLLFSSRITGVAGSLGCTVKIASTAEILQRLLTETPAHCVILDLSNASLRIDTFLAWMKSTVKRLPCVIAYGSHVDTETLRSARAAGCDVVLPRSQFVEQLPEKFAQWIGEATDE